MNTQQDYTPPEYLYVPVTGESLACIFPIEGEGGTSEFPTIWMRVTPDANGVVVTIFKSLPEGQIDTLENILGSACIDYFDGCLSILAFNQENWDQDPMKTVLVENVSEWQPLSEGNEEEGEEKR